MIAGWVHKAFPIDDASRVGEARRFAVQAAAAMDWAELESGRLALVVTELGTNLLRHAQRGRLLIAARADAREVEVVSIDEGPGIADLARSMQDGYSTGSTPGTGMGAVRRLASDFDIHSAMPDGTVCVARVRPAGIPRARPDARVDIGALCLPAPGESESGDVWSVATHGSRLAALMADGLGHGPEAAKAGQAAQATFAREPFIELRALLQQSHQALQTTRGAAICLAHLDIDEATLQWTGAGNVMGRVLSGVFDKSVLTQHGTAGVQIRRPEVSAMALPDHALLVLHSDGIESRWTADRLRPLLQRDPTLLAAVLLRDHTRHRDDATIVVIRRKE